MAPVILSHDLPRLRKDHQDAERVKDLLASSQALSRYRRALQAMYEAGELVPNVPTKPDHSITVREARDAICDHPEVRALVAKMMRLSRRAYTCGKAEDGRDLLRAALYLDAFRTMGDH